MDLALRYTAFTVYTDSDSESAFLGHSVFC